MGRPTVGTFVGVAVFTASLTVLATSRCPVLAVGESSCTSGVSAPVACRMPRRLDGPRCRSSPAWPAWRP